jgi:hypothetical protein
MNKATTDIMNLLNLDAISAVKVQDRMGANGLDFSECTQGEFDEAAREAAVGAIR